MPLQARTNRLTNTADVPQAKDKPEKTNENSIAFPKQITGSSQGEDKKTAKAEHKKGNMYASISETIETGARMHPTIKEEVKSLSA